MNVVRAIAALVNGMGGKVADVVHGVADSATSILQGEPLRAIVYGSAAVIWLVSIAFGRIPDVSVDDALVQATAAAAILTEVSRQFVSPATEAGISLSLKGKRW